jgi:hypothetical protein
VRKDRKQEIAVCAVNVLDHNTDQLVKSVLAEHGVWSAPGEGSIMNDVIVKRRDFDRAQDILRTDERFKGRLIKLLPAK